MLVELRSSVEFNVEHLVGTRRKSAEPPHRPSPYCCARSHRIPTWRDMASLPKISLGDSVELRRQNTENRRVGRAIFHLRRTRFHLHHALRTEIHPAVTWSEMSYMAPGFTPKAILALPVSTAEAGVMSPKRMSLPMAPSIASNCFPVIRPWCRSTFPKSLSGPTSYGKLRDDSPGDRGLHRECRRTDRLIERRARPIVSPVDFAPAGV